MAFDRQFSEDFQGVNALMESEVLRASKKLFLSGDYTRQDDSQDVEGYSLEVEKFQNAGDE